MKGWGGYTAVWMLTASVAACGGGGGSGSGTPVLPEPDAPSVQHPPTESVHHIPDASFDQLDATLSNIIAAYNLSGDPAGMRPAVQPSQDPMVRLGQLLFFSKALSISFETACASCHHPVFGSGDSLSLPVGVASANQHVLGPGRVIDPVLDQSPLADGGPNVPRNSQPIFNVAFYQDAMFWDGRVFRMEGFPPPPGEPFAIRTPDSGNTPDQLAGDSLLEAQARFPVISPDEMRGYDHVDLVSSADIRDRIVARLQGLTDGYRMTASDASRWLKRFRAAFGSPDGTAADLITYENIQKALAEYQASQIFVNSPWRRYVKGSISAMSVQQKEGALLFFLDEEQGGLGCAACHAGDHFTNEKFYNVGFPQFGRGKRADRNDYGRYDVTREEQDRYAFRVPSLLNVMATGPWGHTGAFDTLDSLLDYHADPLAQISSYDFSLSGLLQFLSSLISYGHADTYTRNALESPNLANPVLPERPLSYDEKQALAAFMRALTDDKVAEAASTGGCAISVGCPILWVPEKYEADADGQNFADGNTLFLGEASVYDSFSPPLDSSDYPSWFELAFANVSSATDFPELSSCSELPQPVTNSGAHAFVEKSADVGLVHPHGYLPSTWSKENGVWVETLIMSGGISGGYINEDCWPDLVYAGGDVSGVIAYEGNGQSFSRSPLLPEGGGKEISNVAMIDLNGDFRREWIAGNTQDGELLIIEVEGGAANVVANLPMSRNTFGISFGDYNADGYPDMYLGHWGFLGLTDSAPAFWENDAGTGLFPSDGAAQLSPAHGISQNFNFTPAFADFNMDGWQDLVVASDFGTSFVTTNDSDGAGGRYFRNVTDRGVISDENGMGNVVGDYDNDGDLDWFVTSIFDPGGSAEGNWGVTGNRLYRNVSMPGVDDVAFEDATGEAGVRDGLWGWGACMVDFNNDGWLDIFHENGFGYIPENVRTDSTDQYIDNYKILAAEFITTMPRLFINNGDGTFDERGAEWGLEPSNGRGVVCLDYDRDGDMDIVVADSSSTPKFYENQLGSGEGRHFVSVRLQGNAPNTEALGARVTVIADLDGDGLLEPGETQTRVVQANSNYVSQNPPDLHFGLGHATSIASISVIWPDNIPDLTCVNVPVDRFMIFRHGQLTCGMLSTLGHL